MPDVEIYTKTTCPYCIKAKALFAKKKIAFKEIMIDSSVEKRTEMIKRSHGTTVPQIFINNKCIGGCDDLYALEAAGKLDRLL